MFAGRDRAAERFADCQHGRRGCTGRLLALSSAERGSCNPGAFFFPLAVAKGLIAQADCPYTHMGISSWIALSLPGVAVYEQEK